MAERMSLKRKKSLVTQAERMRAAKAGRQEPVLEMDEEGDPVLGSTSLDQSVVLPGPDAEDSSPSEPESGESSDEYECEFSQDDADAAYQDWLLTLDREDVKMMALMLHGHYIARFGLTHSSAAAEVALLLGFNEKTIRLWRKDFFTNRGEFSEYQRGSYARYTILKDEEYHTLARKYFRRVREYARGYREGFAAGPELETAVKQYKSHRRVTELES